jgi:Family of unknown function (DUF6153)
VRQDAAAGTGRLARWVLLACMLVGLAAMHSLGHGGGMHAAAMLADEHYAISTTAAASHAGSSMRDVFPQLNPSTGGSGDDMAGWSVCLAVLGGFAVAVLLAALLVAAAGRYDPVGVLTGRSGAGPRAPPDRVPVGLALATVSVLRR